MGYQQLKLPKLVFPFDFLAVEPLVEGPLVEGPLSSVAAGRLLHENNKQRACSKCTFLIDGKTFAPMSMNCSHSKYFLQV